MLTIIIVVIIIAMMLLICHIDIYIYIFILHVPYENNNPNWRIFHSRCFPKFHRFRVLRSSLICQPPPLFLLLIFCLFFALIFIFFFFFLSYISHRLLSLLSNNSIFFLPVDLNAGCNNDIKSGFDTTLLYSDFTLFLPWNN